MERDPNLFSFFESTAIPVLICEESGIIIYKNASAIRFLPALRKRANAFSRAQDVGFLSDVKSGKPGVVCFSNDCAYRKALAFSFFADGQTFYPLIFFSRLQFGDYAEVVSEIQEHFSSDFFSFFSTSKRVEYQPKTAFPTPTRLYDEMIGRLCRDLGMQDAVCTCDIGDFLLQTKQKIARPLAALGYRITYSPTDAFLGNRYATLDLEDFSFLFSRSLYAVLSRSKSRHVEIRADFRPIDRSIGLELLTEAAIPDGQVLTFDSLVPEYAWETEFLRSVPLFSEFFTFSEKDGILSAKCHLFTSASLSSYEVRAVDFRHSFDTVCRLFDVTLSLLKKRNRDQIDKWRN